MLANSIGPDAPERLLLGLGYGGTCAVREEPGKPRQRSGRVQELARRRPQHPTQGELGKKCGKQPAAARRSTAGGVRDTGAVLAKRVGLIRELPRVERQTAAQSSRSMRRA